MMFMFTGKRARLQASEVEETVVLVSINPIQMRETFRKFYTCFVAFGKKSKPVEVALSDGKLERG